MPPEPNTYGGEEHENPDYERISLHSRHGLDNQESNNHQDSDNEPLPQPPLAEPNSHESHNHRDSVYEALPQDSNPQHAQPDEKLEPAGWASRILDTWFYEILAITFSLACFITIICVLSVYDGKPVPSFSYGLTFNTIISTLATASKSSLIYVIGGCIGQLKWIWFHKNRQLNNIQLFDSASRGPLGSIIILLQHKGQSLVSLGAIITVLALLFDPFMQQILTYPLRDTVQANNSSSATAKQVTALIQDELVQKYVIYKGQWSDNFDVSPTCPSGNCTWPPFRSVALCSQCEDITDSTTIECPPFQFNSSIRWEEQHMPNCSIVPPQGEGAVLTIYAPSHTTGEESGDEYTLQFAKVRVWDSFKLENYAYTKYPNLTIAGIRNPQLVLAGAEVTLADNKPAGLSPLWDLANTFKIKNATQCAIALCARTYNISVVNGVPSFNPSVPEYGDMFWIDTYTRSVFSPTVGSGVSTDISQYNFMACWKPGHGPPVNLTPTTGDFNHAWVNTSELAFGPIDGYRGMVDYLVGESLRNYFMANSGWVELSMYSDDTNIIRMLEIGMQQTVAKITAMFTKEALLASNSTVNGTVFSAKVYVSVNWIWILLPAALIVLGLIFLLLTILLNRRRGLSLWKSSILAVLFHGLDSFESHGDDKHATISQMEETAENIRVQLRTVDFQRGLMLDQS